MMEFHISRRVRDRYNFAETLFSFTGNVVFASVSASRELAFRMNHVRDVKKYPERAVHAAALYVMGLLDEASHVVMARYRQDLDPKVMTDALPWFSGHVGPEALDKLLMTFVEEFPGTSVYNGSQTPQQWLSGATDGVSHRAAALEELMLLWMANRNQAFQPFDELFNDKSLAERTAYKSLTEKLPDYFATRPLVTLEDSAPVTLFDLLRAPALAAPESLSDQLIHVLKKWKPLLGENFGRRLAIAAEVLHEEELAIWRQYNPETEEERAAAMAAAAAAAAEAARRRRESGWEYSDALPKSDVPTFGDPAHEYEKFSTDVDWMPGTVLIAKSTYVWLAQLSRKHGRLINKLDQIPDEELETLARHGLNSLWLIGIWERSRASKTIKQLCGNQDAVASAYSLFSYNIAEDLGGEQAYIHLRNRAYAYGIRLASDMVPNHMGIDSPWVVEHPEWFISRYDKPYPAYDFDGPDLSNDHRVEIKIEKHYFEQTDAAVVFQRRDRATGDTRYIYHGNDGTSFPWNDTAQLDYLNPAVREQVIQTILHVARLFPVIRFDAAMTLAKRHFHRLWFPGPGSSGAIPSRAEYAMSDAEFNAIMPQEFWREVVDRVATEVPGTLLLAEAFWLMEGYFVRTLGMHRVYNSAFMNMMRDQENSKYRSVIKNTLEFDPDIMKRYVNFMSNPDERTAIDQFGRGDKCFGVAAVMSTLPGLPMFGHGQIEGFTEKYGMEYQRPRYDENPDPWLVERHEREIAPLLHKRWLFAESSNFLLYDFFTESGTVDENVFAYSNRRGNQCGLVIYNNAYSTTRGTVDWSAAYADKQSGGLRQQRLREGLELTGDGAVILAFRDSLTRLEYLRRAPQLAEQGFNLELHAYQCHVFLDWRELRASGDKRWDLLCDYLQGSGVPNLDDALVALALRPTHEALGHLLDPALAHTLGDLIQHPAVAAGSEKHRQDQQQRDEFYEVAWQRFQHFLRESQAAYVSRLASPLAKSPTDPALLSDDFRNCVRSAIRIPQLEALFPRRWSKEARTVLPSQSPQLADTSMWGPVLSLCFLDILAQSIDAQHAHRAALDMFDRLRLREPLAHGMAALGFGGEESWRVAARIKISLLIASGAAATEASATPGSLKTKETPSPIPESLWHDPDVRWLTGAHHAKGKSYFVKERYEELLWWLQLPALRKIAGEATPDRAAVTRIDDRVKEWLAAAAAAGYSVEGLYPKVEVPKEKLAATKAVIGSGAVEAQPGETNSSAAQAEVTTVEVDAEQPDVHSESEPEKPA
jgi:glycosidase